MTTLIEATYRLTTPLFCSGASHDRPELRLASFKGVLRFWWRALAWSRCQGDLPTIQRQEALLFGSTGSGQARVVMRLGSIGSLFSISKNTVLSEDRGNSRPVGMGARYLGYGLMAAFPSAKTNTQAGQLSRAALRAPLDVQVQLRARGLADDLQESVLQALIALGTFGGLGSRSRKGYGSLVLQSLTVDGSSPRLAGDPEPWSAPRNAIELAGAIKALQQHANRSGLPEYTALSGGARHVVLSSEECSETLHLLDLVGREMVRYRSWGKYGRILDKQANREEIFKDDHDLMVIEAPRDRTEHPRRIAFGLPHNYGRANNCPATQNSVTPYSDKFDRRASPLFIHIHQCGSDPVAVVSFLPARFLPSEEGRGRAQINVGGKKIPQKLEPELYKPIHTFLDRLLDRTPPPHHRKEPFTSALEVSSPEVKP
jgi:CRISPR-associated protein Cmr1